MESFCGVEAVTFEVLQRRLIWFVNNRISNGDFSERALARILRMSQSQIHNVLKGARKLTPELADRMLRCFQMSIVDLLDAKELNARFYSGEPNSPFALHLPIGAHIPIQRFAHTPDTGRKGPQRAQFLKTKLSEKSA